MNEDTVNRIDGTNVISSTSPITYKALKAYGEAVRKLNDADEISIQDLAAHFDQAIQDIYSTLAEIELRTKFTVAEDS